MMTNGSIVALQSKSFKVFTATLKPKHFSSMLILSLYSIGTDLAQIVSLGFNISNAQRK